MQNKNKLLPIALVLLVATLPSFAKEEAKATPPSEPPIREIAITIDDLPFVGSANGRESALKREHDRFMRILDTLVENQVPATGFVIAGSIEKGQWVLLERFRNAGFTIGNHTYTHANLNTTSAEKYIENVDRADKKLESLMSHPRYFRYPYLAEGRGEKKEQVLQYLQEHDYIVAPVTIDTKDFRFNAQLFRVAYRKRPAYLPSLKRQYLNYVWKQTVRAEKRAKGRPVRHILLIHANLLNSHFLGDIIEMYRENGYRFITLEEALKKPATPIPVAMHTQLKEKFLGLFPMPKRAKR